MWDFLSCSHYNVQTLNYLPQKLLVTTANVFKLSPTMRVHKTMDSPHTFNPERSERNRLWLRVDGYIYVDGYCRLQTMSDTVTSRAAEKRVSRKKTR